jgi:curved DNA-binding protein CbpA
LPADPRTRAAAEGSLKDLPLPRLLQQAFRKQITGRLTVVDDTGDQNDLYLREGAPVHVERPVDTDRLDRVLVELGVVPADVVARASELVSDGLRLGDVLEKMGALTKAALADVLKTQMRRKLIRLFFLREGKYEIYLDPHPFGEGEDLAAMRVDPRSLLYPGIRASYDLQRVTQELSRLVAQEFKLHEVSPGFLDAMGLPSGDRVLANLAARWQTLDSIDSLTARPLEVRCIVLALYYADLLERRHLVESQRAAIPPSASKDSHFDAPAPQLRPPAPAVPPPVSVPVTVRPAPDSTPAGRPAPAPPVSVPVTVRPAPDSTPAGRPAPAPPVSVPPVPVSTPSSPTSFAAASAPAVPSSAAPGFVPREPSGPVATAPATAVPRPAPPARPAPRPAAMAHPPQRHPVAGGPRPSDAPTRASILELFAKLDSISHFDLLKVSESAAPGDVSTAFVRAARHFHPDRLAGAGLADLVPQAEQILARMSEAAMVLQDPARRAEYVAGLRTGKKPGMDSTIPTVLEAENTFLKGEVFLRRGDHAKAIECFTAASKGSPDEPQYKAYLAWARFDDPRSRKEAIVREVQRIIEDTVKQQPRFARGHFWLGQIWKFLNEPDRAESAFREAATQDREFIEASRELRLLEMRRLKTAQSRSKPQPEPKGGGLMSRWFKK